MNEVQATLHMLNTPSLKGGKGLPLFIPKKNLRLRKVFEKMKENFQRKGMVERCARGGTSSWGGRLCWRILEIHTRIQFRGSS